MKKGGRKEWRWREMMRLDEEKKEQVFGSSDEESEGGEHSLLPLPFFLFHSFSLPLSFYSFSLQFLFLSPLFFALCFLYVSFSTSLSFSTFFLSLSLLFSLSFYLIFLFHSFLFSVSISFFPFDSVRLKNQTRHVCH